MKRIPMALKRSKIVLYDCILSNMMVSNETLPFIDSKRSSFPYQGDVLFIVKS